MASKKQYFNEITLLKAVATLFITWFHFKWSVPVAFSSAFIGGSIGNSIFFFCSGYLLSYKGENWTGEWLVKKYFRIMPAIWMTLLLMSLCTFYRFGTFSLYSWHEWLCPKQFWFVRAILLYFSVIYLVQFLSIKISNAGRTIAKKYLWILVITTLTLHFVYFFSFSNKNDIVMDAGGYECWFYWFLFFVWGYFARNYGDFVQNRIDKGKLSIIGAISSIVLFFAYKIFAVRFPVLLMMQCVFIPLLLAYIVLSFRVLAKYLIQIKYSDGIKSAISLLSNITLEVYIVQIYIIRWLMPEMPFPVNLFVTFIAIIAVAYLVYLCTNWVSSKFNFL